MRTSVGPIPAAISDTPSGVTRSSTRVWTPGVRGTSRASDRSVVAPGRERRRQVGRGDGLAGREPPADDPGHRGRPSGGSAGHVQDGFRAPGVGAEVGDPDREVDGTAGGQRHGRGDEDRAVDIGGHANEQGRQQRLGRGIEGHAIGVVQGHGQPVATWRDGRLDRDDERAASYGRRHRRHDVARLLGDDQVGAVRGRQWLDGRRCLLTGEPRDRRIRGRAGPGRRRGRGRRHELERLPAEAGPDAIRERGRIADLERQRQASGGARGRPRGEGRRTEPDPGWPRDWAPRGPRDRRVRPCPGRRRGRRPGSGRRAGRSSA